MKKDIILKKKKLEKLYQNMLRDIQDYSIIYLDVDGTILTWNKGAEEIKGYKAEEVIGQHFRIFYTPQDRKFGLPEKLLELAKKEGRAKHIGKRQKKDSQTFWGSILLTALFDENNVLAGFIKLTRELRGNDMG
jgi:PAS domain S-box-containing protein